MYKVINRETKEVVDAWDSKNVKFSCEPKSIEEMRKSKDHSRLYFMIKFIGLEYDCAMYEVDKYDLVIA